MNTKIEKQFSDAVRKARKENEHKLPIMLHYALMNIIKEAYSQGIEDGMLIEQSDRELPPIFDRED